MNKLGFTIGFGSIFVLAGLVAMISCFSAAEPGETEAILFGVIFGGVFILVGAAVASIGLRAQFRIAAAKKNGTRYKAKIWEYDADYSLRINGVPAILLVVRFFDDKGVVREERVETGTVKDKKYPLGQTVDICEYQGEFYLLSKKAVDEKIPREHEIMTAFVQSIPSGFGVTAAGLATGGLQYGTGITAADVLQNGGDAPNGGVNAGMMQPAGMQPGGVMPNSGMPQAGEAATSAPEGSMMIACPSCGGILRMLPGTSAQCRCGRQITLSYDRVIS